MNEFKKFISKGNVMEMAVGLIMATYFGAIVKSLVNDVIMPPVGMALGGVDFSELKIVLSQAVVAADGSIETPENAILWGKWVNALINLVLVGFALFMIVKAYNKVRKKKEEAPAPDPGPSEIDLLTEIRDALKK